MRLVLLLLAVAGIALTVQNLAARPDNGTPITRLRNGLVLAVIGVLGFFWMLAAVYVPATSRAVVENTATGSIKVIGPGVHVWPLQPDLVPLASKVTIYNMRRQRIEIGFEKPEPGNVQGVAAGSSSPGNPTVYIEARGWATPDPKYLAQLHRDYGPDYANSWVERNWVTALKAVQGRHPYNYLTGHRDKMSTEVEETLQKQLYVGDVPLVDISQLAITNFDFDKSINDQLDLVANKEFERQKAEEDIVIAEQTQKAEQVKAQTRLNVAKTDAQASIEKAQGDARSVQLINQAVAAQGGAYLQYQAITKWNGILPSFMLGGSSVPFINIPAGTTK